MSILKKIRFVALPDDQYVKESTNKTQIYVHHTAGNGSPINTVDWWKTTTAKIATSFIIARNSTPTYSDGEIFQCYSTQYWGWHLGLTASHLKAGGATAKSNTYLNSTSIGIEICNWGQLVKTTKGYASYTGQIIPDSDVVSYPKPYRGFVYYQKYTQAQLDSVGELLTFLGTKWAIPLTYKGGSMFDVSPAALRGEAGVWTHTSVRPDKNDCHPQAELVTMLQSL